jgi:hypothetical protein
MQDTRVVEPAKRRRADFEKHGPEVIEKVQWENPKPMSAPERP